MRIFVLTARNHKECAIKNIRRRSLNKNDYASKQLINLRLSLYCFEGEKK